MLHLMTFFLVVYIAFLTGIMMYVRVYKAKNSAIELIERTRESLTICDVEAELLKNDYYGNYYIIKHENPSIGKNYYSVYLYATLTIFPNVLEFNIPVYGESRLISSDIYIPSETGAHLEDKITSTGDTRNPTYVYNC